MATATNIAYYFTVTKPGVVPDLVKALVAMAVRETDLVFGPARRKIETEVRLSTAKPVCSIAGGTECGEHLARLFSGFLLKQVGEDGFFVKRSEGRARTTKGGPV
jgi:hypothetical protein